MGIMPAGLFSRGNVGVISRSGTLTYEVVDELTRAGIGQSTVVGIGGDPVIGQTFVDVLERFGSDPQTKAVVLIGEVGGNLEEEGAKSTDLPIVSYIAGVSAPRTSGWATRVRLSRGARAMPGRRSPARKTRRPGGVPGIGDPGDGPGTLPVPLLT